MAARVGPSDRCRLAAACRAGLVDRADFWPDPGADDALSPRWADPGDAADAGADPRRAIGAGRTRRVWRAAADRCGRKPRSNRAAPRDFGFERQFWRARRPALGIADGAVAFGDCGDRPERLRQINLVQHRHWARRLR